MRCVGLLAVVVLLTVSSFSAWACECVTRNESMEEEVARAGLIFSGRVVARRVVGPEHYPRLQFEVVPNTVWKGPAADRYFIYSEESSCMVDFSPGEDYLVMVRQRPGLRPDSLHIERCRDYSSPLSRAPELGIIKALLVPALRANLGAAGPRLNASEAEYFAGILPESGFGFNHQLLGFFENRQLLTKQQYLSRFLTTTLLKELVVFTPAERAAAGGYAAALVAWPGRQGRGVPSGFYRRLRKSGSAVSARRRRQLVRRLGRGQPGTLPLVP